MDLITTQIIDDVAVVPGPGGGRIFVSDKMHKTGEQNMVRFCFSCSVMLRLLSYIITDVRMMCQDLVDQLRSKF